MNRPILAASPMPEQAITDAAQPDSGEPAPMERLLRLLAEHQHDLFRYVFALLPHEADARDVLQETYVSLTRKFDQYDPQKPFLPWAYGFAYMQVLKQREQAQKSRRVLAVDVVEALAAERASGASLLNARLAALDQCLEKLPVADRRLIAHRYLSKTTAEQLAEIVGGSRRTLFRNLERIRRLLHDCISSRVEELA
jgi:RNA polymerase sigma-70 factor (ECF subfamily)